MSAPIPSDCNQDADRAHGSSLQRLVGPTVAVLCVAAKSVYRSLPNVECYDLRRDVRTFAGGMPVVVHPPCRSWSAYCAHQAKPLPGEKELGPICVSWLRECGGVLEHPAHSRLFDATGLPLPGETKDRLWTAEVLQAWWGDTRTKTTWLCFSGIGKAEVQFPIRLHDPSGDRRRWQLMNSTSRSATVPAMAEWMVDVARRSRPNTEVSDGLGGHSLHRFVGASGPNRPKAQ